MSRPPEVSEKMIIDAGLKIQQAGKIPNPGSIRAALGFKGGLLRIKQVWHQYLEKLEGNSGLDTLQSIALDDLPSDISEYGFQMINQHKQQLETVITQSFIRCQTTFESRLEDTSKKYQQEIDNYQQSEISADESIQRLEKEVLEIEKERDKLAKQNADLLIENSSLNGQLTAYASVSNKVKLNNSAKESS
ncbi:DNA-binding protein [Psychrosphaera aestuarii]|uniref:DNA-binding protein n=1 Tax=Psychrosphaera aestuarii TaxID=1266052 RepID=UPI001B321317|nr:DNA-binding protein [Psychrosphaera aestuarii]